MTKGTTDEAQYQGVLSIIIKTQDAYRVTILETAVELNLFDILGTQGESVSSLAHQADINPEGALRILRALCSIQYAVEEQDNYFKSTSAGELLREDSPNTLKRYILGNKFGSDAFRKCLKQTIKTGHESFTELYGKGVFEYFSQNQELQRNFDAQMTASSKYIQYAKYNFSNVDELCDIGGGSGAHLVQILEEYNNIKGIIFDLPGPLESAKDYLKENRFRDQIQLVSGDFFKEVTPAKNYCIKNVLHDFEDKEAITILQNIRKSIQGGRLFVYGFLQSSQNPMAWADLFLWTLLNGKMRSIKDYQKLAQASGFQIVDTRQGEGPQSIALMVCEPI